MKIEELPDARRNGLAVDIDRQEFALSLKTWRLRAGLTQAQAAHRWGTNRWLIIKAENGQPMSWENAYRLFNWLSQELRKEATGQTL